MYITNKNIRKIIRESFQVIKPYAPEEVIAAAKLANLDVLERILRERQKEAQRDIRREFNELLAIAYAGAITFGIFSFALGEDNAEQIYPEGWIPEVYPDPNKIMMSCFATMSNNCIAVLKLVESGLEFPARAMLRITIEHFWLTLVLTSDKELIHIYHKAQKQEHARSVWHAHFRPKKLIEKLRLIEKKLFPEVSELSAKRREDMYSFYTQNVHTHVIANALGEVGLSLTDHDRLETSLFGYPSASSVVVLSELCTSISFTLTLFFEIIHRIHNLKIPVSGEFFPFVHAMRYPLQELLDTVFKYDDFLKMEITGEDDA